MVKASTSNVAVVIPNWNGKEDLPACLDSLGSQTLKPHIIVVENGSTDGSTELVTTKYPHVTLLPQSENLGFAGGVNVGITYALEHDFEYIALLNNDAIADKNWLKELMHAMDRSPKAGIATCKLMSIDKTHLDSTGDLYTTWGLPYPRGRGKPVNETYDKQTEIFGASGGASLYRSDLFKKIRAFDEDFFAYYEDVDISFRAQLAGWSVVYAPRAIAFHKISATSSKIKGFATYQTMKNLPWVVWKNVPTSLLMTMLPRFTLAYSTFYISAIVRGQGWPATKGLLKSLWLLPKKLQERVGIQKSRQVSDAYVRSILTWDLPPNANRLRKLRQKWWNITRKAKHEKNRY